ncbi:hypothetical protein Lesp02_01230 [Lentzea sp. NBRC 105346]|uniref:DUF4389 domain-containing protein n=1 Tax=Lentzea sp. NBRC 105346 TaxID=3032205 RepID=UPI0024A18A38|nr:DUF4389 domain-containing protein [Lentzea sp. NBRC 105346]GLZ27933.1 hypothetical protein Lesp02_01230 [Lentzea sp. NBRC 105346]
MKWWLLAIPHYLIVGFFVGGGSYVAYRTGETVYNSGGGLVSLLALFAAVALLFTGRYPQGVFDFVLGMDRWALRVAAYAGLMTDSYPPFRFDSGGDEPGVTTIDQTPPPTPSGRGGWSGGRIAAVLIGALLLISGAGMAATGGVGLWADQTQRDAQGYLSSGTYHVHSDGYALEFGTVEFRWTAADWAVGDGFVGDIRLTAGGNRFIGIGRADDVARYLSGVERDEVNGIGPRVNYRHRTGGAAADPRAQTFWVVAGTGSVDWRAEPGSWTVVVLNPDGTRVVDTDVSASATIPALGAVSIGLLAGGVVLFLLGGMLVAFAAVRASERDGASQSPGAQPGQPAGGDE